MLTQFTNAYMRFYEVIYNPSMTGQNWYEWYCYFQWLYMQLSHYNKDSSIYPSIYTSLGHKGPLLLTWFNFNPSMDR